MKKLRVLLTFKVFLTGCAVKITLLEYMSYGQIPEGYSLDDSKRDLCFVIKSSDTAPRL